MRRKIKKGNHKSHKQKAGRPRPFFVLFLIMVGLFFFLAGTIVLWASFTPVPDITSFTNRQVIQSTKLYDRTGKILLYDYGRDVKRSVLPLSSISPNIQSAVIAIEDSSFYSHGGIRISSIVRAMLVDLLGGSFTQGGSTITQQVVKNTILTDKKSVVRKIHEWVLAIKLEQKYSKDQILNTYLNDMPFGGTLYGVGAASESFFHQSANNVDIAQAAYLAALLQAPTYYSPYGQHVKELVQRKNLVLQRMKDVGSITATQYTKAINEKVTFYPIKNSGIIAPHFVFYILANLKNKYGQQALQSGLKVITTLNVPLQEKMQSIIATYAKENIKNFGAKNAAAAAIDPSTGQILAMVGSPDYFDIKDDGNFNDTLALRQPGSTFKPFVYAIALEKGFTRNTTIFDLPTQFSTLCKPQDNHNNTPPCYAPVNFDNRYRGPMTFTTALAQSINIPAVKVLYLDGIQQVIDLVRAAGLTTIQESKKYGLSFALGAADVRLLDMVDAYGTFATGGIHNKTASILSVTKPGGSVLEQYTYTPVRIMPAPVANDISAMLSNNVARYPEYPPINPLNFPGYDVAVKTGTTNNFRDAWTLGYTPSIVIGAWVGNNDNAPMVKKIAGYIVTPMWHKIMQYALSTYPKKYFGEPTLISKKLPLVLQGVYKVPNTTGGYNIHSILYWVSKNNPKGGQPIDPTLDPQYNHWEYPVTQWVKNNLILSSSTSKIN